MQFWSGRMRLFASLTVLVAGCAVTGPVSREADRLDCSEQVNTSHGPVKGDELGEACAWRGIPFAAVPLGELRFAPPQDAQVWNTPVDGRRFRSDCEQGEGFLSGSKPDEDCLYLNVYASRDPDVRAGAPLPVMVFIYGGGFVSGGSSSALYAGDQLASHGVVVVTINYRLGPLGYLASEQLQTDQGVDNLGNMGLLTSQPVVAIQSLAFAAISARLPAEQNPLSIMAA